MVQSHCKPFTQKHHVDKVSPRLRQVERRYAPGKWSLTDRPIRPRRHQYFQILNSILNSNHWGSLSWDFPQFTVTNHFEEGLSWGLKFTLNSVVRVARIKTRYFADFLRSVFYVHVIKVVVCVLFWLNMAENDIESLISAAKRKRGPTGPLRNKLSL